MGVGKQEAAQVQSAAGKQLKSRAKKLYTCTCARGRHMNGVGVSSGLRTCETDEKRCAKNCVAAL